MSSSPKKKGGFRWDDVRIFYDDLNTMMMGIMMMTKYDDDERVRKRIRGRRNWPDSGAAGRPEGIWRRPLGGGGFLMFMGLEAQFCVRGKERELGLGLRC